MPARALAAVSVFESACSIELTLAVDELRTHFAGRARRRIFCVSARALVRDVTVERG
jgi:hypothetical protein